MTSASVSAAVRSGPAKVAGWPTCRACSVGNAAPTLMSVATSACSDSARARRSAQARGAIDAAHKDHGALAVLSSLDGLVDRGGRHAAIGPRPEAVDGQRRRRLGQRRLLHAGVEIDVDGPHRRGPGQPHRARQRFLGRPGEAGCASHLM